MSESLKRYSAEFVGTFVLVLCGCGAWVELKAVGYVGVALAIGLAVAAMGYALGPVSGAHLNPAVSLGMYLDRRIDARDLFGYWAGQFLGALAGAAMVFLLVALSNVGVATAADLGCNGFGPRSPVGVWLFGAILVEVAISCILTLVALGSTEGRGREQSSGVARGVALAGVTMFAAPLTRASANPARSFGPALMMAFVGDPVPLAQLWVFIVAPFVGASLAAAIHGFLKPGAKPIKK